MSLFSLSKKALDKVLQTTTDFVISRIYPDTMKKGVEKVMNDEKPSKK